MKKTIQTPSGFQIVDSWNPAEQIYFNEEELPTTEEIAIRDQYLQGIAWLDEIAAIDPNPVIDTLPKAQVAIRQIVVRIQQIALIEKKHLQFHKTQRDIQIQ